MNNSYINRFIMMLFFAAIMAYAIGYFRPKPISSIIQKEKFWALKTHSNNKYQMVLSGDSRLYRGIDPKTVSQKLNGINILNFGYSSGGHNSLIFDEVTHKLDSEAKTKAIVLVLTPYSLTPKAQENIHFKQERDRNSNDVFNRIYVSPFFDFFDPIKPSELIVSETNQTGYYERFKKNGWVASWKIPSDNKAALKSYQKDFEDNIVQQDILSSLYKQIFIWKSLEIEVFAFRIPTTRAMEKLENSLSNYKEDEIRKGVEQAGGKWIDIEDKFKYNSYDGSHLTKESALKFSEYIGTELQKRLQIL